MPGGQSAMSAEDAGGEETLGGDAGVDEGALDRAPTSFGFL